MKEFVFSDGRRTVLLRVTGKFNIISGDSGTGKTYLRSLISQFKEVPSLRDQMPITTFCDGYALLDGLDYDGECLVILDEDHRVDMIRRYVRDMQRSQKYYIIITREGSKIFPYGTANEFTVERTQNRVTMVPRHFDVHFTRNPSTIAQVVVEDSCLGLWLIKKIFQERNVRVITAGNKAQLANVILAEHLRSLVVFDKCGIGGDMQRLSHACCVTGSQLFDSESFEWELGRALFPAVFKRYEVPRDLSYPSAEAYYTSVLTRLLELQGVPYSKSNDELVPVFYGGRGMVHSRFCDLSVCPGSYTHIYEELRK